MSHSSPDFTTEDQEFRRELLGAADRLDEPSRDLNRRLMEQLAPEANRRASGWWLAAAAACMVVLAAGVMVELKARGRSAAPSVRPERVTLRASGPCAGAYRAEGTHALIDDFEDGESHPRAVEGRRAPWLMHFDFDRESGVMRVLVPEPRPDPKPENRLALHLRGPELQDWGALAQLTFGPHVCYDAAAYAGIEFWARGPGRLFAGAQMVDTTPRKWGGTCEKDCYKQHVRRVDLGPSWRHYSLRWEDLRRRGYDTAPLDPSQINCLVFVIQDADSPFDVWLDDVAFIAR